MATRQHQEEVQPFFLHVDEKRLDWHLKLGNMAMGLGEACPSIADINALPINPYDCRAIVRP